MGKNKKNEGSKSRELPKPGNGPPNNGGSSKTETNRRIEVESSSEEEEYSNGKTGTNTNMKPQGATRTPDHNLGGHSQREVLRNNSQRKPIAEYNHDPAKERNSKEEMIADTPSRSKDYTCKKTTVRADSRFDEMESSTDEEIPDSWEEIEASDNAHKHQANAVPNKGSAQKVHVTGRTKMQPSKQCQKVETLKTKEQDSHENEPEAHALPTGGENAVLGHTLKRMTKIDKSFMKTLLTLATTREEDKDALLDKILTDFAKMKSLALEATHEIARLQGVVETQQKNEPKETYATKLTQSKEDHVHNDEIPQFFNQEDAEESTEKVKLALVVSSSRLTKDEIRETLKKRVDPHELGIEDPELRQSRDGVLVLASSKSGLDKLEEYIAKDADLASRLMTKQTKTKSVEVKVVGIEEELDEEEIVRKIISQNKLNCSTEEIKLKETWKGKNGRTAILLLRLQAWKEMRNKTKVNIGWTKCPVYDNTFVPRCNYCAKYGHTQRWCQSKLAKCTECGGRHHFKECKSDDYECCVCIENGKEPEQASHSMMSIHCPTFQKRKEEERAKIVRQMELLQPQNPRGNS